MSKSPAHLTHEVLPQDTAAVRRIFLTLHRSAICPYYPREISLSTPSRDTFARDYWLALSQTDVFVG